MVGLKQSSNILTKDKNKIKPGRLLEVKNLRVSFFTNYGEVKAVDGMSFYVNVKEVIGLVGESGCGKSVSQLSLLQLIPDPPGKILGGEVNFEGENLLEFSTKSKLMYRIRGGKISMIFQEPMTSLNPLLTVGYQLTEVIRLHEKISKREAWEKGLYALKSVGISDSEKRMRNYPFELSGGMRQRVMIATAVSCNSRLIIADEPTTALDVTTQAQVMEILVSLVEKIKTSIIIVTHNLGLINRYAKRIYVMYAGKIIESGTTEDLLTNPRHPYTMGLLKSVPRLDEKKGKKKLVSVEGAPPDLTDLPSTCVFLPRCRYASEECRIKPFPESRLVGENGHFVACHRNIGGDQD